MQNLINDKGLLENPWTIIEDTDVDLSKENLMVPLALWLEKREELKGRDDIAIWLAGDSDITAIDNSEQFPVIGINFPAFADGRGYSLAHMLRERLGYKGDVRAIGDVLIDQLFFMKRCGFSSYLLKDGLDAEKAIGYFNTFTDPYQLSVDLKEPLFRRKA